LPLLPSGRAYSARNRRISRRESESFGLADRPDNVNILAVVLSVSGPAPRRPADEAAALVETIRPYVQARNASQLADSHAWALSQIRVGRDTPSWALSGRNDLVTLSDLLHEPVVTRVAAECRADRGRGQQHRKERLPLLKGPLKQDETAVGVTDQRAKQ
jgi:hypothetical protein